MTNLKIQIALIVGCLAVLILLMMVTRRITQKITITKRLNPNRKKVVLNVFYFLYYLLFFASVIIILGINIQQLAVFLSSVLAILGIAFVAQWSLLSNLTASIIIFFYHPLKIGDQIKMLDKDLDFVGTVTNITGFYVKIENQNKQEVIIPNSLILQKGIEFIQHNSHANH